MSIPTLITLTWLAATLGSPVVPAQPSQVSGAAQEAGPQDGAAGGQQPGAGQAAPTHQRWMVPGVWGSVTVCRKTGTVLVLDQARRLLRFDSAGTELGSVQLKGDFPPKGTCPIFAAYLDADDAAEVLVKPGVWADSIWAFRADGTLLWQYASGNAVNDLCAADLDGDGLDEVVAGYNGGGGVEAVSREGKPVWADRSVTNVWDVDAGDLSGSGLPEIICPGKATNVHVIDAQGAALAPVEAGQDSRVLCIVPATAGTPAALVVGGYAKRPYIGLKADGQRMWEVNVDQQTGIEEIEASPDGRWLAMCGPQGVLLVNAHTGDIAGVVLRDMKPHDAAWAPASETGALLIVATDGGLFGFGPPPQHAK
jgi:hypothetical protein